MSPQVTRNNSSIIPELSSNQEEGDTKLCLHTLHALAAVENGYVIVRNHSGDVDINVILIAKVIPESSRVILDIHNGKHKKAIKLSDVSLTNDEKAALIGFHSFTGNDYCSAFFGKGKQTCWKIMIKNPKFLCIFSELGEDCTLREDIMRSLEEFVCLLYGSRRAEKVDDLRHQLFQKIYQRKNKIIDLSLLPPCQQTLRLHSLRCNFVAKIWKNSDVCTLQEPQITNHGWTVEREIQWIDKAFPDDIEQLLSEGSDDTYFEETDSESSKIVTLSLEEQTLKHNREVV